MREGGEREIMPTRKTLNCGSSFRAIIMSAYILWRKTWVATITANNTNATLDPWFWRWIELVILQLGIHKLPRENRIRKSHFRNQFPPWFHYSENLYNTVSKRSVYKIIQFKKKKKNRSYSNFFFGLRGDGLGNQESSWILEDLNFVLEIPMLWGHVPSNSWENIPWWWRLP